MYSMKTKSSTEAYYEMISILEAFQKMAKNNTSKMNAVIENIRFADLVYIHSILISKNKRFFMPGEIGNENFTIIYTPYPGCTIAFESEPCIKYKPKINLINYN